MRVLFTWSPNRLSPRLSAGNGINISPRHKIHKPWLYIGPTAPSSATNPLATRSGNAGAWLIRRAARRYYTRRRRTDEGGRAERHSGYITGRDGSVDSAWVDAEDVRGFGACDEWARGRAQLGNGRDACRTVHGLYMGRTDWRRQKISRFLAHKMEH